MRDDRVLVVAVPSLEREDDAEPLLEGAQRGRVVVDAFGERADLGGDIVELGLEARQALGGWLEPGVEPGKATRLTGGERRRFAGAGVVG